MARAPWCVAQPVMRGTFTSAFACSSRAVRVTSPDRQRHPTMQNEEVTTMPDIERREGSVVLGPTHRLSRAERMLATRRAQQMADVHYSTAVRLATVQAEGIVQTEKVHELDHLTREAITGHVMLARWASTLAAGDPFIADDLRFFMDTNKLGKGE